MADSFTPTVKKKYTVEAWVSQANSSAKDELDDWRFEVTDNKPTGFKGGNTANWIVGKEYEITVETLMPDFDPVKDGKINWFTTPGLKLGIGQHDDLKTKVTALTKGSHILQAELGGKKITLTITAELAEIKRWCITDKDFDFKSDAGWGEELYALVETSALLAGEKIHLHLLEFDSSSDANYIKDLGEVSFDAKGIAKVKFTTDGIKQELNKLWNERGNYEMFFAAEVKQGAVQFAEVTQKNRGGKTTVYPSKTVSHNGLEKGKFTYIDSKKDITSVRFLKSNDKDAYEVIKYGETIKLKVQTRNLEGTELNLKNILKNNLGSGIKEYPQNVKKKVENEKAEWTLNTGAWRDWAKNKSGVALYQVEIVEADGDKVKYPNEKARLIDGKLDWQKLITYQSLKLSDTNAMSELAKTNAPLIIGEPLEVAQASTGTCVCKDYDLIWGSKVSCEFRKKVVEISKRQNFDPNHLMAVMAVETGESFSASKIELKTVGHDSKGKPIRKYVGLTEEEVKKLDENFSGAVGLIQFTPVAIDELNNYYNYKLSKRKLALMSELEQLNYVEKYIEFWKKANKISGKLTLADLYLLVFSPSKMNGSDDSTTLYKEGTAYYNANKSVDTDGKDGITKKELAKRAYDKFEDGQNYKAKSFGNCASILTNQIKDENLSGVLAEMKEIADSHRPYLQETDKNRTADTESGWAKMDCSEFVSRYLHKLGITKNIIYMTTYNMTSQDNFRKVIENDNIDLVDGSQKKEFKPQKGDIFVWGYSKSSGWSGHTGIVYEYDEAQDVVTILEAIGSGGAVGESKQVANGGYSGKGCTRTAKYGRLDGALHGHTGWVGYFRPKNYTKKL